MMFEPPDEKPCHRSIVFLGKIEALIEHHLSNKVVTLILNTTSYVKIGQS